MRARAYRLAALGLTLVLVAGGRGHGQTLPERAELLAQVGAGRAEALLATAPWSAAGGIALERVSGAVTTQSWHIPAEGLTTFDLGTLWAAELAAEGFAPGFACVAVDCGGFDFRFAIPVLPEPDMHVDLGDFRYMTFRREGASGPEHRIVLISRGPGSLYAQITTVLPAAPVASGRREAEPPAVDAPPEGMPALVPQAPVPEGPQGDLIALLVRDGRAVLEEVDFASGSAELPAGDYAALAALGDWLAANPAARVTIVGHTDATGGAEANLALSNRRASSVRDWINARQVLTPGQVLAEGAGYLSPRASNLTPEGRALNRRVEVVLLEAP